MIVITRTDGCITIAGHAHYDVPGKDIVCAAISALEQTFVQSVRELTTDNIECVETAGKAVLRYGKLSDNAQVLMASFFVGLRMIAEAYPDNVRMSEHLRH